MIGEGTTRILDYYISKKYLKDFLNDKYKEYLDNLGEWNKDRLTPQLNLLDEILNFINETEKDFNEGY